MNKMATRWRQYDVLGCISSQGGCGAFCVPDGQSYTKCLQDKFISWYRKQRPASFKEKIIFMQDNTSPHAARYTIAFLEKIVFKDEKLMIWPPA